MISVCAAGKTFYLDGVKGNDAFNGSSQQMAVKTVARLLSLKIKSSDTIYVARGTVFREFMDLKEVNDITIRDYGTGSRPVFDAADTARNSLFTKRAGSKYVYAISWKNNFGDNTDVSQYSIWENGKRLKRTSSIEECNNSAGSFFAATITQPAGTDTLLVHASDSSDVTTNGKLYEIARRSKGIETGDNCRIYNMHTRRNGSNDGSFKSGLNSYVYGVLAEDGVKHNFFMASGTAENCMAWKSDDPREFGGSTLFISYTDSRYADTMNLVYKNCIGIAGKGNYEVQYGVIGLYAHTGSVPYRTLQVGGGVFAHTSTAISAELKNLFIDSAFFINNITSTSKLFGNMSVRNCYIIPAKSSAAITSDKPLDSVYFINNKVYMPGDYQTCIKLAAGAPAFCECLDNTVFYNHNTTSFMIYYNSGGGTMIMKRNLCVNRNQGALLVFSTLDPFTKTIIEADSNHYATGNLPGMAANVLWTSAAGVLKGLDGIKSGGFEIHSSEEPVTALKNRISGTYETTDFFLPATDPLHGKQGSSSTFDSIERYPYRLGDTLGVRQQDTTGSVTPVDTTFDFTVTSVRDGNELTWEIAGVDSIDHYNVEFSTDSLHFSVIATISQEPGKEKYDFLHQQPSPGNNFYRIVAVTADSNKRYSKKILIYFSGLYNIVAGPNPVSNLLHVEATLTDATILDMRVFAMDGRVVWRLQKQVAAGRQVADLNLQTLQPGIYNLVIQAGSEKKIIRIVKQ